LFQFLKNKYEAICLSNPRLYADKKKNLPPDPMKTGVIRKLFDMPKIAPQIDSWKFEPQRKDNL